MGRNIVQGLKFNKVKDTEVDGHKLALALEEAYLMQRRPAKFTKKQTFSPSSIGYGNATCARYWYLAFDGAVFEDDNDALGIANMSYGTQAHTRIEKLFKDAGLLIDQEIEIKLSDPPIRGYMDVMIKWDGQEVPGEIKTTRGEMFAMRQASMKPPAYNLYQILIYMKATKKKNGFLLYENKNDQSFLVIPVTMDDKNEKILEDAFTWLRTTRKAWEDQQLPNRPVPTKRNKICKSCPVRNTCWDDLPEGENIIPLMEVAKP
jgi:CRISPR/Cas system-associated exonuclease Cas4 (RecB family)